MNISPQRLKAAATLAAAAALTACASAPQLNAQWTDPALGAQSSLLKGAKVAIACDAYDTAVKQVCQDQLAIEVLAHGATPVLLGADQPAAAGVPQQPSDGQLLPAARTADAKAVLVLQLTPAATDASSGVSVSIGGFGFGRNSALGGGVTAPLGGGQVTTGFAANGRVTSVASGRLVWTATAVAPPSADLAAQFGALSKTVLDAAQKAGLF